MNPLAHIIEEEIATRGPISFARFMELALYCPVYGYYEREEDNIGRGGDYFTSVSVGGLFGQLLAWQFAKWLEESHDLIPNPQSPIAEPTEALQIIEAGAHDARLARDILAWFRQWRPKLFERLEYWIIEPSARRRQWQERTLDGFKDKVRRVAKMQDVQCPVSKLQCSGLPRVRGIIFSNELLDSFPVHRLGWDAQRKEWFEWGVTAQEGRFQWTRLQPNLQCPTSTAQTAEMPSRNPNLQVLADPLQHFNASTLQRVLPDGFIMEVCPAAEEWWRETANTLVAGRLMTIDYGLGHEELFVPERPNGTLRAFRRHHASADLLDSPGQQDLTAHVNFDQLQRVGEQSGLQTEPLVTQEQFFTRIAAQIWNTEPEVGKWTPEQMRQFKTLTHPEHLGRAFRVLIQSRLT